VDRMQWVAELFDRMSGPAKRIARNLDSMNSRLNMSAAGTTMLSGKQKTLQENLFGSAGESMRLSSVLAGVSAGVIAAGAAFGLMAYQIGKTAFENFAFKESALATGKALWGSSEAADAMFTKASQLAKLTPFNVGDVVKGFNKLGAAGFKMDEVPVVFQGLSDIAAMSGRGADAVNSLGLAFSQIMGKGHLAGQELNQITEAAGGAVSSTKLFAQISKIVGRDVGFADVESGAIGAREAIMGVMQIAKQMGGGIIGQNSIEQSKTLGGLWSNLQDTVTNLWLTMDIANKPWFKAVKSFVSGMVDALDSSSRAGQVLQGVFDRLFGDTIGRFIGDGSKDMTDTIIAIALAFETVAQHAIAAFHGLFDGLAAGFGPLIQGLGALNNEGLQNTHDLFAAIGTSIADVVTGFAAIGAAAVAVITPFKMLADEVQRIYDFITLTIGGLAQMIGGGLVTGLTGGFVDATSTMDAGANDLIYGFKRILGIASPSKVFEGFGENVVEGFNSGVERVPGMDASLGQDLAAGAAGRGTAGGAGGSPVSVGLTINVNATGGADGDSIAQRIAEVVPTALANLFDQLATERGAM
jgi:hypothetical protein